jgi:NADPH:quinone reductase-like Zn-dependent oxidoreductase
VVSHEFALEDAAKAHALIEQGHVLGKVILAT